MKIALIGYGKMGKTIEKIALDRNHTIVLKIDENNVNELTVENLSKADVAIDFSIPSSAFNNIKLCFKANTPVVCGTTGWLDKFEEVTNIANTEKKGFFYASNYSLGVNIFFKLNKYLAKMMNQIADFQVSMEEVHHIHKLDAPSGTAITLLEDAIAELDNKKDWVLNKPSTNNSIGVKAIREDEVPGIHRVNYDTDVDSIHIEHAAKSRKGFAFGAVLAAEHINGKTGYHTMDNILNID
jgi:4-hydroxy-tetrahydrodipicolinate reductase